MAYVVAAIWTAKEGQGETILEVIRKMTPLSRQEPGCLYYQAQRSLTDPRVFFLYELYVDAAGYEAHMVTPHFERYVKGEAIPNLESRERAFYETIDVQGVPLLVVEKLETVYRRETSYQHLSTFG